MRERTTWNRDQITTAAKTVTADPYAMNQDHLQQQPKADKYLTGDPSSFAEDVTEPNTWDREYAGGTTERDEIGLPAFRGETFNHAEKSASMDEKTLIKKADLCSTVARMILRGRKFASPEAATEAVESQAVALMYMPNKDLINTASRLSSQEDFPGGQTWPSTFAGDQQQQQQQGGQQQDQQAAQQQQAAYQQAMQQCMQAMQQGDQQGAMAAMQQMVQQAHKSAAAKRAAEEGQQQGQGQQQQQQAQQEGQQQGQGQQQDQQAATTPTAQMENQALEAMLNQAVQQQVQAADYDAKKGPAVNPPGYGPYNGPQAGGAKSVPGTKAAADEQQQGQQGQQQQQAGQVPPQFRKDDQGQGQQGQGQGGGGQQQAQQQIPQGQGGQQQQSGLQQQADDQLLDDMLMGPQGGGMNEVDIEMEPAQMDMGEVVLSSTDDEVLKTLFANEETQDAEQAQQAQQGKQAGGGMSRTASNASTRTLGTRPTGGVSHVGGAPAPRKGSDVDSLTALWPSAPDVREAFNMR